MAVDDNLVEQNEFIVLTATASTGASATQILLILNNDSEYYVLLKFTETNSYPIILLDALIGFDQDSYTVNEADDSVTVCVVFLVNSGIQDPGLTAEATISATDGTAIGIVMCIRHAMG